MKTIEASSHLLEEQSRGLLSENVVHNSPDHEGTRICNDTSCVTRDKCSGKLSLTALKAVPAIIGIFVLLLLARVLLSGLDRLQHCENKHVLSTRQEWRTLTKPEQKSYIAALQCLRALPSRLNNPNVSRWDDFPWTHYSIGYIAHDAACFLSWHRWFLVLFERSLRDECGFNGALPYWDWSLDWRHPEQAPVFDSQYGFGGNGLVMSPIAQANESCVMEGPFSGAQIPFDAHGNFTAAPHCLSREFALGHTFNAPHLDTQHIESVLSKNDYWEMMVALERGPHNDIPQGINGTFLTLYAPADPIFYLHHAQLDRLWWIWQNLRPKHATAYSGPSTAMSKQPAELEDVLHFGGLSLGITVKEIIHTRKGRLCYGYDKMEI